MKRFALVIVFLILNIKVSAQNDSISKKHQYVYDIEEAFELISYRGGFGLFIPSSKEYFRIALYIEFNMNIPISALDSIELAAQIGGWDRENNFNYVRRLDSLIGTSRVFLNGVFKYKKDVIFFNKSFISVGAGIGISTISINTQAYILEEPLEVTPFENMTSMLLAPELEYVFDVTEITQFSLSVSVQYVDYKLKSALQNDIDNWYFLPKVTYRF